jgi:hypothetical protein
MNKLDTLKALVVGAYKQCFDPKNKTDEQILKQAIKDLSPKKVAKKTK